LHGYIGLVDVDFGNIFSSDFKFQTREVFKVISGNIAEFDQLKS